jgi:hypothetical protein
MTVGTNEPGAGYQQPLNADLTESQTPAEVLQATGRWMAIRLADTGFEWRSTRRRLEMRAAGRSERIGFHGSRHNRSGRLVQVWTARLEVYDEGLGRWRQRHPTVTVSRPPSEVNMLCWSSYLDLSRKAITVLTDPGTRVAAAEALAVDLETVALPWFAATRDATTLVDAVPDGLLRPTAFAQDLLEYLVSRDLPDQAQALIRRFTAFSPAHANAFSEGRRSATAGERPNWHTPAAFGWSSQVLGLA